MTKAKALEEGYCKHCAAASTGRQLCGVTSADQTYCILGAETALRWKSEHDLGKKPIRRPLVKSNSRTREGYH